MRKTLKRGFWECLSYLPVGLTAHIVRVIWRNEAARVAELNKQWRIGARIKLEHILSNGAPSTWNQILLIGGPARVGKSTIGDSLAQQLGATVLRLDDFRPFFIAVDRAERIAIKYELIRTACRLKKGLVIEGDELVCHAMKGIQLEEPDVALDIIHQITKEYGAIAITVGATDDLPSARASAILAGGKHTRCWATESLNQEEIEALATRIVSMSRKLEQEAHASKIPYFNINCDRHAASINRVVDTICNFLGSRGTPDTFSLAEIATRERTRSQESHENLIELSFNSAAH